MSLKLLAADEATVLFDFDSPTGSGNPSTLITNLGVGFDVGTLEPEFGVARSRRRAAVTSRDLPPVEMAVPFMASAASYSALRSGLGQLAAWLEEPPGPLEWVEGGVTLYIDLLGALNLPALIRGQTQGGLIATRLKSMGPIPLRLLRTYGMRGAAVSVSGVTVPMDPTTSTKGRVYVVAGVTGDLPTTGKLRVQMDSQSTTVQAVTVASRARKTWPSSYFADWLSDTGWADLNASARGWTVALGTGTITNAVALSSGGNAATVNGSQTSDLRRVTLTRTTKMDSLRGAWNVVARVQPTAASVWRIQLRCGPGVGDPPQRTLPAVLLDTTNATAATWVDLPLGVMSIPTDPAVALSGARLEFWAQRISGTGNLHLDTSWHQPAATASRMFLSGGGLQSVNGANLVVPTAITGDPTWTLGVVSGTRLRLDALNEGGAIPSGIWGAGTHRITFSTEAKEATALLDITYRVVNLAGSVVVEDARSYISPYTDEVTLTFEGVGGQTYEAQAAVTAYTAGRFEVKNISRYSVAGLATSESIRTDPNRQVVDRLDTSGNIAGDIAVAGEVPVTLWPGDNHVMIAAYEGALQGYTVLGSLLARTPTASLTYPPRYAL